MEEHMSRGNWSHALFLSSKVTTYVFIMFVVIRLREGGDFRYVIPYIAFAFACAYLVSKKNYTVFRSPLFLAALVYVAACYLLLPFSISPSVSFTSLNIEVLPGLFIIVLLDTHTRTERDRKSMIIFLIGLLVIVLAGSYYSYIAGIAGYLKDQTIDYMHPIIRSRFIKFSFHHNIFAWTVNALMPFAVASLLSLYVKRTGTVGRAMLALVVALSVFGVLLSLSRGGWAGLFIIAVLWLIYIGNRTRKLLPLAGTTIIGIVVLSTALFFFMPSFRQRIFDTKNEISTLHYRTVIWKSFLEGIRESPVVGWGYGMDIIWDGKPVAIDKRNRGKVFSKLWSHSHSMILDVLFHQGVLGLVAFLSFLGVVFMSIIRTSKNTRITEYDRSLSYAVLCAVIGVFVVQGLVEVIPFTLLCLLAGIMSGVQSGEIEETHDHRSHHP
jgi:O-antigen ligase